MSNSAPSLLSQLTVEDIESVRRHLAKTSLIDFASMIDIPTAPITDDAEEDVFSVMRIGKMVKHHELLLSSLQSIENGTIPNLMVLMPPGSAKALALDTPIPTPEGWKIMGALKVGDKVFGDDGLPCNVKWVSQIWKNRKTYNVTTDCGDVIQADEDHEWLVRLCGKREIFKIKETKSLCKKRSKRPMIKRAEAIHYTEKQLPIDPYLLGVWLGDGTSAEMSITSSEDDSPWLRSELHRLGYTTTDRKAKTLFGVKGVRKEFVKLGLINYPWKNTFGRKHIPEIYMRGSISQRLSLLQGLVDTDGTVCKKRGRTTFCNTNKELAVQVRELVRSLGVKAGWTEGRAILYEKDCGAVYRVGFYLKYSARMPRKAVLTRNQHRTPNTYIDVAPAGIADTVCIEVDSASHLFLAGESMTPTHNSVYCDVVFVPWFMSRKPRRNVILASYASDIASKQGRRARQLIKSKSFQNLIEIGLSADNAAADRWAMDNGSEYMAGGLLSGLTGNRAHLGIVDDPLQGREQAESEAIRRKTWDAYQDDFCSRLIPGAPQIMILCMTGDTRVRMANGKEKLLMDIVIGDEIATYENGRLSTSLVKNWINQGKDFVYEIRTTSGIMVKANERHPFLVDRNGQLEWVRVRNIKSGDVMVSVKNAATMDVAQERILGINVINTPKGRIELIQSAIMGNGLGLYVLLMGVISRFRARVCAVFTTEEIVGQKDLDLRPQKVEREKTLNLNTNMASGLTNTKTCSKSRMDVVRFVKDLLQKALQSIGEKHFVLTTATTQGGLGVYCAMTAISLSAEEDRQVSLNQQQNTFSRDKVISINPCGMEEVFDIQVARTENFIANGLVSHNTRWHEDDLAGRILPDGWDGQSGEFDGRDGRKWHVLCLPAIADRPDDPLGRKIGEVLWPEWFSREHFEPFMANRRTWSSLYQQKPSPDDGDYFKADWFGEYEELPPNLRYYGASDYAVTDGKGDYTEHGVAGIDGSGNLYIADWWRGQTTSDVWIEKKCDFILKYTPHCWFGEAGPIRRSVEPYLAKRMQEREAYCRIEWIASISDKPTRTRAIQAMASMGKIFFPKNCTWKNELITQMLKFPHGKYDDGVDVMGLFGVGMEFIKSPKMKRKEKSTHQHYNHAQGWMS